MQLLTQHEIKHGNKNKTHKLNHKVGGKHTTTKELQYLRNVYKKWWNYTLNKKCEEIEI